MEYFCPAQEIFKSVFLASSIIEPKNNLANFMIVNVNDHSVYLNDNISIKSEPASNYNIFNLNSWVNSSSERLHILESEIDLSVLNEDEKATILKICREYDDIFFLPGDKLTTTDAVQHDINLIPNSKVIHKKPYRLPEAVKPAIKEQIEELLENDIIESSSSPWNFPLLIVPKKSEN